MSLARLVAIAGAAAGICGLMLQYFLMLGSMGAEGFGPLAITWRFLGYFTLLTNIFVALIWVRTALRPETRMARLEAAGAVSIVMVGIIYHLLLASRWNPQGLQLVADIILHTATPILFALYWLIRPHGRLKWIDAFALVIWPLAYCPYALVRGAFDSWYAYFFLDPNHMSPVQLVTSIAGLSSVFLVCALVLIGVDKILAKRAAPSVAAAT
jgi:hypothetical protein